MFLHERVNSINERLKVLKNVSNTVIWGAGIHTCKLFEKTDLLSYSIKDIVDISNDKKGNPCFGFVIKNPEEIAWDNVDMVVVSVPGKESQITDMLVKELNYAGDIMNLYENDEITPFYLLYDQKKPGIHYFGNYDSWEDACRECNGYDDKTIIETVSKAVEKISSGGGIWERDGVVFDEPKYNYPICASILKCALQNEDRKVRILDIGGSLGSTYFQNRKYLADVIKLEYVIAEQDNFVTYGKKNLENKTLRFIYSSDDFEKYGRFDIALLSASLQYIEQYEEIMIKLIKTKPRYIILDRIPISGRSRICIETVPERIYKSSYPLRIFSENEITDLLGSAYTLIEKDVSSVGDSSVYFVDGQADYQYFVFELGENT